MMERPFALRRAVLSLVAAAAFLAGCDYFRPADPERAPSGSIIVPDYSHHDSTLAMIGRAFADKGKTNGGTVYAGAFSESTSIGDLSYHQFFSLEDSTAWQFGGSQVPTWTFPLELTFYNRFINLRGDSYHLVWGPDPVSGADDVRPDIALIHRHYLIVAMTRDSTVTSTLAVGYADLELIRGSDGNWRIVIWMDRRDPAVSDPEAVTLGRRRLNSAS